MVKAMAEASLQIQHNGQETKFFFSRFAEVKAPGVAIDITKKLKGPSPLRRLFFSTKTKRKDKDVAEEGKLYVQDEFAKHRVIDVPFEQLVELPCEVDLQEWLATSTIKFFDHINQLYGAISEYCTTTGCTCMAAPNNVQYLWIDDKGKKVKCAAPQYIDHVMLYTQKTICDETVFPTKYGNVFPASFDTTVKKVSKLLFHVLAHIYHSHFKDLLMLHLQAQANTLALHFMTFCRHFSLVEERELLVLDDLFTKLSTVNVKVLGKEDSKTSLSSSEIDTVKEAGGGGVGSGDKGSFSFASSPSVKTLLGSKTTPATPPNSSNSPSPDKDRTGGMLGEGGGEERVMVACSKGLYSSLSSSSQQTDLEENKENSYPNGETTHSTST